MQDCTPETLDPCTFNSVFFLSAAQAFQDHLYSGWLGAKAREKVEKFQQGTQDGTMHADWKDEIWETRNIESNHPRSRSVDLFSLVQTQI